MLFYFYFVVAFSVLVLHWLPVAQRTDLFYLFLVAGLQSTTQSGSRILLRSSAATRTIKTWSCIQFWCTKYLDQTSRKLLDGSDRVPLKPGWRSSCSLLPLIKVKKYFIFLYLLLNVPSLSICHLFSICFHCSITLCQTILIVYVKHFKLPCCWSVQYKQSRLATPAYLREILRPGCSVHLSL